MNAANTEYAHKILITGFSLPSDVLIVLAKNREKAFQILSARLLDRKLQQEVMERRSVRRALVRGADRSEKVRTYNWAQVSAPDGDVGVKIQFH